MSDLISREDAIKALNKEFHCTDISDDWDGLETAIKIIEALPSADDEWIPITTSEPTTSDHVLVTYKWGEDDYETIELDYWVTKCAAEEGNKQCQMFIDHVIAWSFMPQPYKEI